MTRALSLIISIVVFAAVAASFQHYVLDDSYISFRFARNLANGDGLVFNPGERVEGYTNFLWVVAIAWGMSFGARPEVTSFWLSLLGAIGTIYLTGALVSALSRGRWRTLPSLMIASSSPFVFWAFTGMETTALTFLLIAGVWCLLRSQTLSSLVVGFLLLGLGCLVRPDAALFLAISLAAAPLLSESARLRRLWLGSLSGAVVLLPYATWKLFYYGSVVPNTFYAKVGARMTQLLRGCEYDAGFLLYAAAAAWLPLAVLALVRVDRRRAYLAALVIGQIAYTTLVGGDHFMLFRLLIPTFPVLCALTSLAVEDLVEMLRARQLAAWPIWAALALGLLLSAGFAHQGAYRDEIRDAAGLESRLAQVGLWLKAHSVAGDTAAVVMAGAIPFFSELNAIDMLGLTDSHIARRSIPSMGSGRAGHEKGDGAYVFARRPRYILINPITSTHPLSEDQLAAGSRRFVSAQELWALPQFHQKYRFHSVPLGDFHFGYFEREPGN